MRSPKSLLPFLLAFLYSILIQRALYPSHFVQPEIWHEAGTNFLFMTRTAGLWENLTKLDAGYLPLIPRLVALKTHYLGIPVEWIPSVYNGSALLFISFCCSFFALPIFRKWIASDWQRMVLCLALASYEDYELHNFVNFSYYGGLVALLSFLSLPEIGQLRPLWRRGLSAFIGCVFLSKGITLVFLPIVLWLFFQNYREKNRTAWRFLVFPLMGLAVQGGLCLWTIAYAHFFLPPTEAILTPKPAGVRLWSMLVFSLRTLLESTVAAGLFHETPHLLRKGLLLAASALLVAALVTLFRRGTDARLKFLGASALWLAVATTSAIILFFSYWYSVPVGDFPRETIPGRWALWQCSALFLFGAICISQAFAKESRKGAALGSLLLIVWVLGSARFAPKNPFPRDPSWPLRGFGDWPSFVAIQKTRPTYCVPLNPFPEMLKVGCEALELDIEALRREPQFSAPLEAGYPVPAKSSGWSVQTLGLVLKAQSDVVLETVDATGKVLESVPGLNSRGGPITYFHLTAQSQTMKRVRFHAAPEKIAMHPAQPHPLWVWLGSPR